MAALLTMVALLWLPAIVSAQERFVEGFSRTRPILRPASDVPAGTIRQLRFSGDAQSGLTLYSAGDDKLVRHWAIKDRGAEGVRLEPTGVISWPIFRAIRGVIYALDVQRTTLGDRIAFGGVGTKTSQVQLLHQQHPAAAQLLVDSRVNARNAVYAVAFRPDGRQLAVGHDLKPLVLLWDVDTEQARTATTIDTGMATVWYMAYNPSGSRLAIAGRHGQEGWQVQVWDPVARRQIGEAVRFNKPADRNIEILGLAWSGTDQWSVATNLGIRTAKDTPVSGNIRAIASLSGQGRFVIASYDSSADTTGLFLWDGGGQFSALPDSHFSGVEVIVQSSPDGAYIAAGGLANRDASGNPVHAIRLWRTAGSELVAQVPDESDAAAVAGAIANVGFIAGGTNAVGGQRPYSIGFRWGKFSPTTLPAYRQAFLRFNRRMEMLPAGQALGEKQFDRSFVEVNRQWFLQRTASDRWGPLPSWGARVPKCYAHNEHFLALGYSDGLLLCDLRGIQRGDADQGILRSYYGHESQVTCMDFAPDGNLLVSGSLDGTICGWRINDLNAIMQAPGRDARQRRNAPSELGAEVGIFSNGSGGDSVYIVKTPLAGSTGSEAGFRQGDRIIELLVAGRPVTALDDILSRLRHPVPGKELTLTIGRRRAAGAPEDRIGLTTTVSHDPLWTLYPRQDNNWVLWTPEGSFDASPEMIDRLQWHFDLNNVAAFENVRRSEGAMVFRGRDFKELYFRPDLFDTLLDEHVPDVPQVSVIPPSLQIQVQDQNVVVKADPNGVEEVSEIEVWLNSYRLARFDAPSLARQSTKSKVVKTAIPPQLLRGDGNQITAVAAIDTVGRQPSQPTKVYNRMRQTLPNTRASIAPPARQLHYLGVGVTELRPGVGLSPLQFSGNDAVELGRTLRQAAQQGNLSPGQFTVLAAEEGDQLPTEDQIHEALKRLAEVARADDLAIVFFSGHGISTPEGYRFVAQDTAVAAASTISDQAVNDYLALLPCRSLLLLDTCHAEGVQREQTLRDWPGLGLGPQILTSCDASQESFEHHDLGVPNGLKGHGLFTAAILEALTGQRVEQVGPAPPARELKMDGGLSVEELCQYVKRRTEMLSGLDLPFVPSGKSQQMPKILPSLSFADTADFPLIPVP